MEGPAGLTASSLSAVLFDADGVVQHPAVEWRDALASVLDSDADVDGFLRDLFAAEQPTLRGQGDFPSIVADVLARWGCAGRSAHVLRVFQDIVVDRAVLQVVAELRQAGVYCALATNQNAHRARYMSDELGYARAFDHAFYSCDIGFTKPDPRFFRAVLDVLPNAADQVLFIDDHQENVASARDAGIRAILFQPQPGRDSGKALRRLLEQGTTSLMSASLNNDRRC